VGYARCAEVQRGPHVPRRPTGGGVVASSCLPHSSPCYSRLYVLRSRGSVNGIHGPPASQSCARRRSATDTAGIRTLCETIAPLARRSKPSWLASRVPVAIDTECYIASSRWRRAHAAATTLPCDREQERNGLRRSEPNSSSALIASTVARGARGRDRTPPVVRVPDGRLSEARCRPRRNDDSRRAACHVVRCARRADHSIRAHPPLLERDRQEGEGLRRPHTLQRLPENSI